MQIKSNYKFETVCVHGTYDPFQNNKARAVPLYQSSAFMYDSADNAAELFSFDQAGHIYMRIDNPTVKEAENRIAMLERGIGAVCFASGMAAMTGFFLNFLKQGDRILAGCYLYGGTSGLLRDTLPKLGIESDFFDPMNPDDFSLHITPDTRVVLIENLANPALTVPDMKAISALCKKYNIPLVVDNTIATPFLSNPGEYGADFIIHSCTKYMEGHGNIIGGAVVDCGSFTFDRERYPLMYEEAAGGENFYEKFGQNAFLGRMRGKVLMNTGGCMAPFHAYMLIHGLESFHVRMARHCENASKLAGYLKSHPSVEDVIYPEFNEHQAHENAVKYLHGGFGGMVGFTLKGGYDACKHFIDTVKLLSHTTNIGDTKTLVIHPASTTHRNMTSAERRNAGIADNFIRMSVGIENAEDLIMEITKALGK